MHDIPGMHLTSRTPHHDGGETGGYDPPPRQQRQIWFWLNLTRTKRERAGIASPYFHNSYICIKIC